jgi:hypothetical protein
VHNGRTRFVIFLFRDPHLLEGGKRCQDGTSDPDGVFPLRWSNDFDFHRGWSQRSDFLLHSVSDTWVHCGTSRENGVSVQVLIIRKIKVIQHHMYDDIPSKIRIETERITLCHMQKHDTPNH